MGGGQRLCLFGLGRGRLHHGHGTGGRWGLGGQIRLAMQISVLQLPRFESRRARRGRVEQAQRACFGVDEILKKPTQGGERGDAQSI